MMEQEACATMQMEGERLLNEYLLNGIDTLLPTHTKYQKPKTPEIVEMLYCQPEDIDEQWLNDLVDKLGNEKHKYLAENAEFIAIALINIIRYQLSNQNNELHKQNLLTQSYDHEEIINIEANDAIPFDIGLKLLQGTDEIEIDDTLIKELLSGESNKMCEYSMIDSIKTATDAFSDISRKIEKELVQSKSLCIRREKQFEIKRSNSLQDIRKINK